MFGNLVQIELIRLFKSKALKISAAIGAFLIVFVMIVIDYALYLGALDFVDADEISEPLFEVSMFIMTYAMLSALVAPVTVIYTTCGYKKARLSVNIECAIRSRLKLCLSEVTGIGLFVLIINLLVIPAVLLIAVVNHAQVDPVKLVTDLNIIYVYTAIVLSDMYSCLIAYLISKFTSVSALAMAISLLYSLLSFAVIILLAGFVNGYKGSGLIIPDSIQDLIMYVLLAIPVVAMSTALAVRYRRTDRI